METKKSHKADLEHRRPFFFVSSFVGVTLLFLCILFIPFKSIGNFMEEAFDDYTMDLELKEKDEMISAALPQQKKEDIIKDPTEFNKVDEATEEILLTDDKLEKEKEKETVEETEEEPPVNLNKDDEEILKIVEELPEYPGGMSEFVKWLTANLKYPERAMKRNVKGKVMVSFIVNKDGTISDIKLAKSVDKLLDEEALRVVRMMPNWKPGLENGQPCRTMVAIPIVFEI